MAFFLGRADGTRERACYFSKRVLGTGWQPVVRAFAFSVLAFAIVYGAIAQEEDKKKEQEKAPEKPALSEAELAKKRVPIVLRDEEFYYRDILQLAFERWKTAWCDETDELNQRGKKTFVEKSPPLPPGDILIHLRNLDAAEKKPPKEKAKPALVAAEDLAALVRLACECKVPLDAIDWIESSPVEAHAQIDFRRLFGALTETIGADETIALIDSRDEKSVARFAKLRPQLLAAVVEKLCNNRSSAGRPASDEAIQKAERVAKLLTVSEFPSQIPKKAILQRKTPKDFEEMAARSKLRIVQSIAMAKLVRDEQAAIEYVEASLPKPYRRFCLDLISLNLIRQGTMRVLNSPPPFQRIKINPDRVELDSGRFGRRAQQFIRLVTKTDDDIRSLVAAIVPHSTSTTYALEMAEILTSERALRIAIDKNEDLTITEFCRRIVEASGPLENIPLKDDMVQLQAAMFGIVFERIDDRKFLTLDAATQCRIATLLLLQNRDDEAMHFEQLASGWEDAGDSAAIEFRLARDQFYERLSARIVRRFVRGAERRVRSSIARICNERARSICRAEILIAKYTSVSAAKLDDDIAAMRKAVRDELKNWKDDQYAADVYACLLLIAGEGELFNAAMNELKANNRELHDKTKMRIVKLRLAEGTVDEMSDWCGDGRERIRRIRQYSEFNRELFEEFGYAQLKQTLKLSENEWTELVHQQLREFILAGDQTEIHWLLTSESKGDSLKTFDMEIDSEVMASVLSEFATDQYELPAFTELHEIKELMGKKSSFSDLSLSDAIELLRRLDEVKIWRFYLDDSGGRYAIRRRGFPSAIRALLPELGSGKLTEHLTNVLFDQFQRSNNFAEILTTINALPDQAIASRCLQQLAKTTFERQSELRTSRFRAEERDD